MYQILIAEYHPVLQRGLGLTITENIPDTSLSFVSSPDGVFAMLRNKKFDLLILDIGMPLFSFSDFEQIIRMHPDLKVLVHSQFSEHYIAAKYLKSGAYGYINKNAADEELLLTLKTILRGKKHFSPEVINEVLNEAYGPKSVNPMEDLSNQEHTIVQKLVHGISVKKIAEQMNLSLSAVSTYKKRAMRKLQVESFVELLELTKRHIH